MNPTRRPVWSALVAVALAVSSLAGCAPSQSGSEAEAESKTASGTSTADARDEAPESVVIRDAVQNDDGAWVAGLPLQSTQNVSLGEALADPAAFEGQTLRITARVEQVCQTKGCWMIVTDGEHEARVTFEDYGFFVPKHVAGATVEMDVQVQHEVMDEETARHLASETEGQDPDAITGPVETVSVVATGVRIVGGAE